MQELIQKAKSVLEENNQGHYTSVSDISDSNRWTFCSSIAAMGWAHIDLTRALDELSSLFDFQYENGMLPHLSFNEEKNINFFPGQAVWKNDSHSFLTQAPVWTLALEYCLNKGANKERIKNLLPKIEQSHKFFYLERDPLDINQVSLFHPWESETEDSPSWDPSLNRVPTKVHLSECPDDVKSIRFLHLAKSLMDSHFKTSDFSIYDPHATTLLALSERALERMSILLGFQTEARERADHLLESLKKSWDKSKIQAPFKDGLLDMDYFVPTLGSLSPVLLHEFDYETQNLVIQRIKKNFKTEYGFCSCEINSDYYHPDSISRGAISLTGHWYYSSFFPDEVKNMAERLIRKSGFRGYYHAESGRSLMEGENSLAAALFLVLLD